MKIALLLLAGALAFAAGPEDAVKAALDKLSAAAKAGDEKALNALIADDVTYSHSNAKMETKAEAVAALVKSKTVFTNSDVKIRVNGNTAIVNLKIDVQPNNIKLSALQVWTKKGNNWQLAARQTTRLP